MKIGYICEVFSGQTMDVLKRYTVQHKALGSGKHTFTYAIDTPFFQALSAEEILGGTCEVQVVADKNSQNLLLHTEITGSVAVSCDRCLEPLTLEVDFAGDLMVRYGESGEEEGDGECLWVSANENEIELAQYLYESIYLSLPLQRIHAEQGEPSEQCNPEMLARFQVISEEEFEAMADQSEEAESAPLEADETLKAQLEQIRNTLNER